MNLINWIIKQDNILCNRKNIILICIFSLFFLTACNKTDTSTVDSTKETNISTGVSIVEGFIDKKSKNFLECEAMSGVVMESYPRQCKIGESVFIEDIEKDNWNKIEESISKESIEKTWIKSTKIELQQAFKDIEANMQVVDDNMQALDVDDSELESIGF